MRHYQPRGMHYLLVILFSVISFFTWSQTIQPHYFGINAWMPDTIGDVNNCASPPCIKYGKLHANWQKVKDSRAQAVRYGGISPDKNKPTDYQYIRMIDSIRNNGMEPIVQVPHWDGRYSAQQAAAIVQYVNVTRGRNVKYWVVGNEPDLKYGATSASDVAGYLKAYASAMKAVDPTIKIIGPETAWFNKSIIDGLTNPGGTYDVTGKDANGRYYLDIISFHTYPMGDNNSSLPSRSSVISELTSSGGFEDDLTYLNGRLAAANSHHSRSGTSALQAAVTEANVVYQNSSGDNVSGVGANSFLGAQFVAELYGIGLRKGLAFVNLWSVIEGNNVPASLGYIDHYTGVKKPLYYHYQMMAENFKGNSINATSNQGNVKVFASRNGQQTTVLILSQEFSINHSYALRLNTGNINGSGSLKIGVDAGIAAEYTDNISNQSTVLLQFDGGGNLTKKCVYTMSGHALQNLPPTCTQAAPVDLVINSASANASSAQPGGTVALTATVFNSGTATSSTGKVGYYLSSDNVLNSNDHLLGFSPATSLSGGSGTQKNATVTIPSGETAGSYYILVKADYSGDVAETNENNNVKQVTFTIQPAPLADLVIQNATSAPAALSAGGTLTLQSTIYNSGATGAAGVKIGYYFSNDNVYDSGDVLLASSAAATVNSSGGVSRTNTVVVPAGKTPGNYYVLFYADYNNQVTEASEQNNFAATPVQITQPQTIDLSVSAGTVSPSAAPAGASVTLSGTVHNSGTATASLSSLGFYYSTDAVLNNGDDFLGSANIQSLGAGNSAARQFTAVIPSGKTPGAGYLLFVADDTNGIAETNENNNTMTIAFTVQPAPHIDLVINKAAVSPASAMAGATITVSSTLHNNGNAASATGKTGYYLSSDNSFDAGDSLLGFSVFTNLNAGADMSATQTVVLPSGNIPGTYYVLFVADHENTQAESNEQNNVTGRQLNIIAPVAAADLSVSGMTLGALTVLPGASLTVAALIKNVGGTSAGSGELAFYLSADNVLSAADQLLGTSVTPSLAGGATALENIALMIPGSTAAGKMYVLAVADHKNDVQETDENNNEMSSPFTVGSMLSPDLKAMNPVLSAAGIVAGDKLTATATIYNAGNQQSTSGKMGFYLSTDTLVDPTDVHMGFFNAYAIAAGKAETKSVTYKSHIKQPAGVYYILAMADHQNEVAESDEQNNLAYTVVTIAERRQDVRVKKSGVKSGKIAVGDNIEANAEVQNTGNVELSVGLGYYLSTDSVPDISDVLLAEEIVSLQAGDTFIATARMKLPSGVYPGEHHLLVIADHKTMIAENNENDNLRAVRFMVTDAATGIGEFDADLLRVYPNPSTGRFTIAADGAGEAVIVQVYDISGKVVYQQRCDFSDNSEQIVVPSSVAPGVYLLKMNFGEGPVTRQIMITR